MQPPSTYISYCGTPPTPDVLWLRWNLDPVLCIVLIALAVCCAPRLTWVTGLEQQRERSFFFAGWLALAAVLISPLCNLSIALFSARVGQHMGLALVVAPLLALSKPWQVLARRLSPASMDTVATARLLLHPTVAATLFGTALWYWHMPRPYQATFESHLVYWIMHATLTGSAVLLWESLLERGHLIGRLLAAFATLLQMGMLGAVITLSPRLLYPVHQFTTQTWGLTPLDDQQLGGLIMWVPGCSALALILLVKMRELFSDRTNVPTRTI